MKFATVLPLAAVAGAFVLPDVQVFEQLAVADQHGNDASWWDVLPSKDSVVSSVEDTWDTFSSAVGKAAHAVEQKLSDKLDGLLDEAEAEDAVDIELADGVHTANLTIYELLLLSNHTTKFAKLVGKYDGLVKLLNSTDANYTLFVPTDRAFEKLPDHDKDKAPSKEVIEAILSYHVGVGFYPAGRILTTPTVPTALHEKFLGGEPQRLRTSVGLSGVRVNFYSKVVKANIKAKNGIIHGVSSILVPPPFIGKELSLLPDVFSTLLHAYEKTDFVKFIHGVSLNGSTVFAPTNKAFAKLGPRANAFLFNTEKGLVYLKALLKYQIVANTTLYSNALYGTSADGGEAGEQSAERSHYELATLLEGKSIGVDVSRWGPLVKIRVNGYVPVVIRDGIAKNGVIQVVGSIPIPPHKHGKGAEQQEVGEIDVEDLKERLEEYVDREEKKWQVWGEL
jgi:uncharacterized surface protein with fasciclin (FAS1) repeats